MHAEARACQHQHRTERAAHHPLPSKTREQHKKPNRPPAATHTQTHIRSNALNRSLSRPHPHPLTIPNALVRPIKLTFLAARETQCTNAVVYRPSPSSAVINCDQTADRLNEKAAASK